MSNAASDRGVAFFMRGTWVRLFMQWRSWRPGTLNLSGRRPTLSGTITARSRCLLAVETRPEMHEIIYLIGLVVVVMFVLSLLGLR
jgi:hypothetical protein